MSHIIIQDRTFDLVDAPKVIDNEVYFVLALTSTTVPEYLRMPSLIPRRLSDRNRVKINSPELGDKEVLFVEQGMVVAVDSGFQVKLKGILC